MSLRLSTPGCHEHDPGDVSASQSLELGTCGFPPYPLRTQVHTAKRHAMVYTVHTSASTIIVSWQLR
jgi:hypothetical protein